MTYKELINKAIDTYHLIYKQEINNGAYHQKADFIAKAKGFEVIQEGFGFVRDDEK